MKKLIKNSVLGLALTILLVVSCREKPSGDSPTPPPSPKEQYINVPDAGLREALKNDVDKNKDGRFSLEEVNNAAGLSRLDASNKNIQSLVGIEYFTNLKYLNISNNKLTSPPDLSKLTKLEVLIATGNQLSGKWDLSNSPNLKYNELERGTIIVAENNNPRLSSIQVASSEKAREFNNKENTTKYTDTNINITFSDDKLKACLVANSNINTNKDGEISVKEAEQFTGKINCTADILKLDDLQYFKNITQLEIHSSSLQSANISGFAKLKELTLSRLLSNITLTNLPSLEELNLNQNQFVSLTLTGLPALRVLSLSNNEKLTNLNINGLTNLQELKLLNVKISGVLDLSGLTKLLSDENKVQIMVGGTNPQITSIKVATSTLANLLNQRERTTVYTDGTTTAPKTINIPDNRLKIALNNSLNRDRNQNITTSDIEKITGNISLTGVSNISGLENFKNITGLDFSGSTVTTANLTPFTKLEKLTLGGSSLGNVTVGTISTLKEVTILAPRLKKIDLSGCVNLTKVTLSGTTIESVECIRVATQQLVDNFKEANKKPDSTVSGGYKYPTAFRTTSCN